MTDIIERLRADRLEAMIERLLTERDELFIASPCQLQLLCLQMDEIARLRAALLTCPCPGGGWNGMPRDPEHPSREATVADCLAAGVCGCMYGDALGATTS